MRRIDKSPPPNALTNYESNSPNETWGNFKDFNGGEDASIIKTKLFDEQYDLCAYCEVDLSLGDPQEGGTLENNRRVEHFKSKSGWKVGDPGINWGLDWYNVIAVCVGGTDYRNMIDYSMPENKSCDSFKEHLESQSQSINKDWHGNVLFPLNLPYLHQLFTLNRATGELKVNFEYCSKLSFIKNNHSDTADFVKHTIISFNLNCDRLNKARLKVFYDFERAKKQARISGDICKFKYFLKKWGEGSPKFFQTTRDILINESPRASSLLKGDS